MTEPVRIPQLNPTGTKHNDLPAAPGIANPAHVNHIANFFKMLGHGLKDVFIWAPTVGMKTVTVIQEAEKLTPEFMAGLKNLISDVAVITANGALAAASRGANIESDYNVLQGIEKLAGDFNIFYPILIRDFKDFEGIIDNPGVPASIEAPGATAGTLAGSIAQTPGTKTLQDFINEQQGKTQPEQPANEVSGFKPKN